MNSLRLDMMKNLSFCLRLLLALCMMGSGCGVWAEEYTWDAAQSCQEGEKPSVVSVAGVPVTIEFKRAAGSYSPTYKASNNGLRLYVKNTVTFTASEGYAISGITVNFGDRYNGYTNITASVGDFSATYPSGKNEKSVGTWASTSPCPCVTINNTSGINAPIASLTVTYIPLTQVGTITVSAAGSGTFCPLDQAVVVGDGTHTKVFTGLAADGETLLEEVMPVVPLGTGVYVEGEEGAQTTYQLYSCDGMAATAPDGNLLVGVTKDTPAIVGTYVLQNGQVGVAFYHVETAGVTTVKAGRAYLRGDGSGVKAMFFRGVSAEAVGISQPQAAGEDPAIEAIYTLDGQRTDQLRRGINIVRYSNGEIRKHLIP